MQNSNSFREVFFAHEGKYSDKWDSYLDVYDQFLNNIRYNRVNILEIGVQNGGSLEIWDEYFPNALSIVGCDINEKCSQLNFQSPKIKVVIGDAASGTTKTKLIKLAKSYSLIVDDGSHHSRDIIDNFTSLFPLLEPHGLYVVEDMCCSYWSDFGGGLNENRSAMSFFKSLTDVVNFQHWGLGDIQTHFHSHFGVSISAELALALSQIRSVTFINSMCVINRQEAKSDIGPRIGGGRFKGVDQLLNALSTTHGEG